MKALRVLVVDDSDGFRATLVEFLGAMEGIEIVSQAKSGREALLLVRALAPDVVLLDISMRGINGLDTARFIKQESPDTRVVFVTIHDRESYRELLRGVHVDGFINKSDIARDLRPLLRRFQRSVNETQAPKVGGSPKKGEQR